MQPPAARSESTRTRRRIVAGTLALLGLGAGAACGPVRAAGTTPPPMAARLGDFADVFSRRYATLPPETSGPEASSQYRRILSVPEGRLLLDVLPDGRVRQITVGRMRDVAQTWDPDPQDWSLALARSIGANWLPADAALQRSEPFLFQERQSGIRDVFFSASLAKTVSAADYAQARVAGPPGACAATYYQTSAGGVAFLLVGLI